MSRESNGRLSADIMEYLGTEGWDNTVDLARVMCGFLQCRRTRIWVKSLVQGPAEVSEGMAMRSFQQSHKHRHCYVLRNYQLVDSGQ